MSRLTLFLDFNVQPYSIGDTILALAGAMAVADERGLDGVDVLAVADPRVGHADPNMAGAHATPWQSLGKILPLCELAQVGSFRCFTAGAAWGDVHVDARHVWPPGGVYLTYEAFRQIAAYHERHGHPPRLHFSPELCAWADMFLSKCGRKVITVNLRNNIDHHHQRNFRPDVWAEALARAREAFGVSFCVVGETREIRHAMRGLVTFAKDRGTSLLDDMALIHRSAAHVGSTSGPMAVAMLGQAPHYFVNADMKQNLPLYEGTLREDATGDLRFSFASPWQRFSPKPETVDDLVAAIGELVRLAWPS